jgi:hypothetical protein
VNSSSPEFLVEKPVPSGRMISMYPILFLRKSLVEFTLIADEHETTIWAIPFIDVSECVAVFTIIDAPKSSEGVIIEFVDKSAHYSPSFFIRH